MAAARFWGAALGRTPYKHPDPVNDRYRDLQGPGGEVKVMVQSVGHESRVHLDIETDDVAAEVARLEALGARRVVQVKSWWVMEAPTGQRFCVVRPVRDDFDATANTWGGEPR